MSRRLALGGLAGALFAVSSSRSRSQGTPGDSADRVTPEQFGAKGDGRTIDTAAINRALAQLARMPGGELRFEAGATYLIDAPLDGTRLGSARLRGDATLKARDGSDFPFLLSVAGTAGVTIDGLTFDANKAGRRAARGRLSGLDANGTDRCRIVRCTFTNTLGSASPSPGSAVAVSASAGCTALLVEDCRFADCGESANVRPSDGVFVRGNLCIIRRCHAEWVTDHGFVLEGCNNSRILGCTGTNCTSIAGMSNDMAENVGGNVIAGIRGTSNYLGSFGGIVDVSTFGAGALQRCTVRDIAVTAADGARGGGAGLFVYGRVEDLVVENATIDAGRTSGVMNHAVVIDGARGVTIRNSRLRADGIGSCIRLLHATTGVRIDRSRLENGGSGIAADGAAAFVVGTNSFVDCKSRITLAGRASYRTI